MSETEIAKTFPCDESLRARLRALRDSGEVTNALIAKGARINDAVVSQYLNDAGNLYPGEIVKYERHIAAWLEKRDLEFLAGIKTVECGVARQIEKLTAAVRRQRIIGKATGIAGIGKTRGASLTGAKDSSCLVYYVSKETGSREALRSALFKKFGVRGGAKTYGSSTLDKYNELVKRAREADVVFLFDQAHMLSKGGKHFLCEFWNATRRGQLWIGTDDLYHAVECDSQIASRTRFGDTLIADDADCEALVRHQIKSVLPEVNGEFARLTKLCVKVAEGGKFRDVEMLLGTMLYLSEKPDSKNKTWAELFDLAFEFF